MWRKGTPVLPEGSKSAPHGLAAREGSVDILCGPFIVSVLVPVE